jgi:hypothetical protein
MSTSFNWRFFARRTIPNPVTPEEEAADRSLSPFARCKRKKAASRMDESVRSSHRRECMLRTIPGCSFPLLDRHPKCTTELAAAVQRVYVRN